MMKFIENKDGTEIDSATAKSMRTHARALWRTFYEEGNAPDKWGNATSKVCTTFFQEMEAKFPVLCYCDDNWKTNHIATLIYSTWYPKYHESMSSGGGQRLKKRTKTSGVNSSINGTSDDSESPPPEERDTAMVNSDAVGDEETESQGGQHAPGSTQRPRPRPLRDPL